MEVRTAPCLLARGERFVVSSFGLWVSGSGFEVWGLGFRGSGFCLGSDAGVGTPVQLLVVVALGLQPTPVLYLRLVSANNSPQIEIKSSLSIALI
jgi:hypothetical protein